MPLAAAKAGGPEIERLRVAPYVHRFAEQHRAHLPLAFVRETAVHPVRVGRVGIGPKQPVPQRDVRIILRVPLPLMMDAVRLRWKTAPIQRGVCTFQW